MRGLWPSGCFSPGEIAVKMNLRVWILKTRSRRIALILLSLVALGQFVRSNLGTFSVVDGVSMCPTFQPNDVVQVRANSVEAQRGDVVIVTDERGDEVIKRVIGLPGESVTVYRGFVYINHQRLVEPYLPKHTYTFKSNQRNERAEVWQLGDDEYFVLGDNRPQSTDSRHYGPIPRQRFHGMVNTPANDTRPGFAAIVLQENPDATADQPGPRVTRQHRADEIVSHREPAH